MHRPAPIPALFLLSAISLAPAPRTVAQESEPCTGYWRQHVASPGAGSAPCVAVVPDGRLFVGVPGTGLRVFRPEVTGGEYLWTTLAGPVSNRITRLRVVGSELWVGTEGGVSVLDLATDQWRSYTAGNSPLPSNLIRSLTRQGSTVWIGTAAGAARRRVVGQNESWTVLDAGDGFRPGDADIRDIAVHRTLTTETVWITGQSRLYTSNAGAAVTEVANTGDCRHETASRMLVDLQNDLWFGALDEVAGIRPDEGGGGAILVPTGLCRHRPAATWTHFADGLGFFVNDLALDGAGRLWAALAGRAALHDQGTWCFYRQQDGTLFSDDVRAVGTAGEGVWFGHGDAPRMTFHSPNWSRVTTQQLFGSSNPFAALLHAGGRIHAGVGNRVVSTAGEAWASVALPAGSPVSALGLDPAGQVCAGTAGGEVYVQTSPAVFSPLAGPGLPAGGVRALASDGQGRLWAATPNGLALRGNGYWLPFTKDDSALGTNDLRALAVDAQDRLWIASDRGIYVLAIAATGESSWISFDVATGLPSNDIRALAAGQGVVWTATAAGAAMWNGTMWNIHDAASGALPGDDALSVTVDPAGRVWVGTTKGLARKEGSQWTHFHVTGSTLANDRVTAVAASDTTLWAANGTVLARRDEITGPIGFAPPTMSSMTPASGAPGVEVTINGTGFDARGLSYNYVTIGNTDIGGTGFPARAEVVSVTETRIVVRVPERATTGRIRVTAHELTATSAADFIVTVAIISVEPTCVSVGDEVTIKGGGFYGAGGGSIAEVRVGNGAWRTADRQTATELKTRIRTSDTAGQVRVRLANGALATAPQMVTLGSIQHTGTRIQQAIEGIPLVWGKRTLIHLDIEGAGCSARVTGGSFEWKRSDGTLSGATGALLASPGGSSAFVTTSAPIDAESFGVDFVARTPAWPLSELAGGRVLLTNNGVEAFSLDLQRSDFPFIPASPPPKLIAIGVHTEEGVPGTSYRDFWDNAWASLEHVARMYPAREAVRWGPDPWITWTPMYFRLPSAYLGATGDDENNEDLDYNYCDIKSQADDIVDPDPGEFAMALVDGALHVEGAGGRAPIGPSFFAGLTAVSFNFAEKDSAGQLVPGRSATGPIIAQEFGHMLGLVDDGASNHDRGNDYHSRFDEGEGEDEDGCALFRRLTFRSALLAQLGSSTRHVVRLDGGRPWDHSLDRCASGRPRSVMSYARGQTSYRGHLEPEDFAAILTSFASIGNFGGGGNAGAGGAEQALRIRGTIWDSHEIRVGVCYLTGAAKPFTPGDPEGDYRLELRGVNGEALGEHRFALHFHGHGESVPAERFALHVPFPAATASVQILHDERLLWAKNVSEQAPVVSLVTPAAGSVIQGEEVTSVRWTASDPDGDALQFALDYSPDSGATWHKLPQFLQGTSFDWQPLYLPPSRSGVLRIRASDGFHTATALSATFTLVAPAPLASIRTPEEGEVFLEGARVDLVGGSITAGGEPGTFHWEIDGAAIDGMGPETAVVIDVPGSHTIRLRVTDAAGEVSDLVERRIEVIPDFDGDGLPNDHERQHGFDPLFHGDAGGDADGDGLSNLGEYRQGTDPRNPDTDGDGWTDGAEIEQQTSPLHASDSPSLTPLLLVGAERVGFTAYEGEPAPEPIRFWITNGGGGNLAWTAAASETWVDLEPLAGTAPTEIAIGVDPAGLAVGHHEAQVIVNAAGAAESPQTISVRLEVHERHDGPGGPRFLRGDCNADGRVGGSVTDAVVLLSYNFTGGTEPPCLAACDVNGDGRVAGSVTDAVYLLSFSFLGGPRPPAPFPECDLHPAVDRASCKSYEPCE